MNDGIGALEKDHRSYLADDIRGAFADSLNLDEAMREGHEQEHRWDYLLGHTPSAAVVALEPHSASSCGSRRDVWTEAIAISDLSRRQLPGEDVASWVTLERGTGAPFGPPVVDTAIGAAIPAPPGPVPIRAPGHVDGP